MERGKAVSLAVTSLNVVLLIYLALDGGVDAPPLSHFIFWIGLLVVAELLPVSMGFGAVVTMAFPIAVAVEILYPPLIAMVILGAGAFDMRELRREISWWRALFNRSQLMLAGAAASAIIHAYPGDPFSYPMGGLVIAAGATAHATINWGLVIAAVQQHHRTTFSAAARKMLPRPIGGFVFLQVVLATLGAATAAAFQHIGAFVAAFLIPLILARLSIIGARNQQELAERLSKQQQALLVATEKVFQERERERTRIAEDIHDSGLQMLAAAVYNTENARTLLRNEDREGAEVALRGAAAALDGGITSLREALMDLARSSIERESLMENISAFADRLSTLWGTRIKVHGAIENEPPVPVSLTAFQILQEGLTNALKHSKAESVSVRVDERDGQIYMVVEDKGQGFDSERMSQDSHVGLRLMSDRAARVGGSLSIQSKPGSGTRVEAVLPAGMSR